MKKLLNILGTFVLLGSLSSSVVSCSSDDNSRISNYNLPDRLKNEINAEIADSNYNVFGNMTNEEIWNSNDDAIQNLLLSTLNNEISSYFYSKIMQNRADETGTKPDSDSSYDDTYNNEVNQLSNNTLYEDYSKDVQQNDYLENKILYDGYSPDYQSGDWNVTGVLSNFVKNSGSSDNPDTNTLKNTTWEDNPDYGYYSSEQVRDAFASTGEILPTNLGYWKKIFESDLSAAKTSLQNRFKTYEYNEITPEIYKNMIVNEFLKNGEFGWNQSKKTAYINKYSPMFYKWQSWDNSLSSGWYSNMKMVWEFRYPSTILTDSTFGKLFTETGSNGFGKYNSIKDVNDAFAKNDDSGLPDPTLNDGYYGGDSYLGNDPTFGVNGYEGLYGIDSSSSTPTIFTSNSDNSDISLYKDQLTSASTNKPGFLQNSDGHYYFNDTTNQQVVVVFSLPIYAMDLIGSGISYTPYNQGTDSSINNPISTIDYSNGDDSTTDLLDEWKSSNNNGKTSSDVTNLNLTERQNLFSLIESTIGTDGLSTDSSTSDTGLALQADTALYSYAFDYNPDNIYSSDLYNAIGNYVKKI